MRDDLIMPVRDFCVHSFHGCSGIDLRALVKIVEISREKISDGVIRMGYERESMEIHSTMYIRGICNPTAGCSRKSQQRGTEEKADDEQSMKGR